MPDYDALIRAFRDDTAGPPRPARAPVSPSSASAPAAPAARPSPSWLRPAWAVPPVALAAAALFALRTPPADSPLPPGALVTRLLTEEVALQVDGIGTAGGTRFAPRLEWASGRLGVEVTPERGVHLSVHTPEATVEVIGTGFDVRRGPLGTAVEVRHGRVRVSCAEGAVVELTEGASHTCRPVTAAGLLGRARALQARGEPYADEVATALTLPDATGAVAHELRSVRLDALIAAGDPGAFALAEQVAAEGGPRALDAHRAAARLAGDCPRALPHLTALADADALGEDAAAWEACRSEPPR